LRRTILQPPDVHAPVGYSHAARTANTLYVAGQIAKDVDGRLVGEGDIHVQLRQVFTNLQSVLRDAGATLGDIVKMTTYLTDISYVDAYRQVRNETFKDPLPPSTLVVVKSLFSPEYLVEIEAIAALES
jgi:enamine deaminase RidA (YjgF/YER057c/UK114 family)